MKASLPDSTSISSHFTLEYTVLLASHGTLVIQRLSAMGKKEPNLDCQTLQCCTSLVNFDEAKLQHNLPTHNTCKDLWSNKLILRALINL